MSGNTLGSAFKCLFSKEGNGRGDQPAMDSSGEMEAILPLGVSMWKAMCLTGEMVVKLGQAKPG